MPWEHCRKKKKHGALLDSRAIQTDLRYTDEPITIHRYYSTVYLQRLICWLVVTDKSRIGLLSDSPEAMLIYEYAHLRVRSSPHEHIPPAFAHLDTRPSTWHP